ncbi:IPT/TIG domain-containing protein [Chryseolinea lacunae]|uniref:IPT/TIG domain-containing protein n=1 Tax=Chryseolinea lacunae TaxID=2801331 RepID=A0ABS1KXP1_9BACT|nr:IPT/TIG domain-containing protein [Chryseolinea lacunae]MBL0744139.1 IPT/TIG domain-containing protein [Chryseolinea lacunae]
MKSIESIKKRIAYFLLLSAALMVGAAYITSCKSDDNEVAMQLPAILAINPTEGNVGSEVTITGSNFSATSGNNAVTFSGVPATVLSATETTLVAKVPANATTGPVAVTVNGHTATGPEFKVLTATALAISSIEPTSGVAGIEVTLTGTGFSGTAASNVVKINGVQAEVKTASATQLVIIVPASATTGEITVAVNGQSTTGPIFTILAKVVITDVNPKTGAKGTQVTISGSNFSSTPSNTKVTFNGKAATVISATTTSLVVEVPAAAGTGNIKVELGDQKADGPSFDFIWTYTVSTLAGGQWGDADGVGTSAGFLMPYSLTRDNDGNLLVGEMMGRIRKVTLQGNVTTLAGSVRGYADGPVATAQFNEVLGIAVDKTGNIFVTDAYGVRKIDTQNQVSTFAGNFALQGSSAVDGKGNTARFRDATGLSADVANNLYLAEANAVRKIAPDGTVTTLAGSLTAGPSMIDGSVTLARFNAPSYLATATNGDILILDNGNARIRKLTNGQVTTFAGMAGTGFKDGTLTDAKFSSALGHMTIDKSENIYIVDGNCIRKITPDGKVSTVAGLQSEANFVDGVGSTARFSMPMGIVTDANGNVYVADANNNAIRKIIID